MTRLSLDRPLVRQTDSTVQSGLDRGEPLIVELNPKWLTIRVKGKRQGYDVPYALVMDLARKLAFRRAS